MAAPTHTVIQLSDLHLSTAPPRPGIEDGLETLEVILDDLERAALRPSAIVLSGDLADAGEPQAYRRLRRLVDGAADSHSPVQYVMGNHDDREAFRAELLAPGGDGPCDGVCWSDGLRLVALDTTVPGCHHGELHRDQLDWLTAELAVPAADGTLLTMHHPPVPSPIRFHDEMALRRPEELAEVLRGSDVRMILAGHAHVASGAALGAVPVWVSPSTAYSADPLPPAGRARAIGAAGYTRVDVYRDAVVASYVPLQRGEVVYDRDLDEMTSYVRSVVGDR